MADAIDIFTAKDIAPFGDIASAIDVAASMHGITADPDPIDAFTADVNRLCDRPIQFDRIEMLLIKVQRAGLIDDDQGFALHAAYLMQRAEGVRSGDTGTRSVEHGIRGAGSDLMQTERAALERAAQNSLAQRRASGAILSYELDGWMVREHPGGRIERLAPIGQFRVEDHPHPGFTPPSPPRR